LFDGFLPAALRANHGVSVASSHQVRETK
jgi:hypothetical protein